jgi:hypothetical protein
MHHSKIAKCIMHSSQGKGMQTTFWLTGKDNYDKQLPPFDDFAA